MFEDSLFWRHWYFYLPDYVLAALIYTLIARFAVSFFVRPDSQLYIWRFFRNATDWAVRPVAAITPRAVPPPLLLPIAAFWLFVLRAVWTLTALAIFDLRLATGG